MKTRTQHGHCGHGTDRSAAAHRARCDTEPKAFSLTKGARDSTDRAPERWSCALERSVPCPPCPFCVRVFMNVDAFFGSICLLANARPPRRTMFPVISVSFFGIL